MRRIRLRELGLVSAVLVAGCTAHNTGAAAAPSTAAQPPAGCDFRVNHGELPEWARTGFTGGATVPYVIGQRGDILAGLFGYPLTEPEPASRSNKILWVSRPSLTTPDNLKIDARLDGTNEISHSEVPGGPGPSIINVPRAGCWHFTLRWSGHTDSMDLRYLPG